MAAELLLSTLKKPETPLASQPKAVKPPAVTPEPVTGLPPQVAQPLQSTLPSQAVNKSALTWSTEPAINPAFKTPQVSATPQAVTTELPWKGTEGFNPNYTPISDRDAAFGDPSLTREQKNILTQNLLKSKGLDTGAQIPQTDEEQFRIMRENQIAEQTYLDKQIQQGLAKAKRDLEGSRGAIEATVGAVNREGLTSASNQMVATKALEGFNAQFNQLSEQYAEQQRQLRRAQQQENWAAVDRISRNMENTQLALQASSAKAKEEAQGWVEFYKNNGVFDTATPEQLDALAMKHGMDPMVMRAAATTSKYKTLNEQTKAELDNRIKGVGALTNIFEKGGELTLNDITSLAGTFDIPIESAISAYQGFNAIRNDKLLSNDEKLAQSNLLRQKLDREMRGITNSTLETQDYFQKQVLAINANPSLSAAERAAQISNLAMNLKLDDSRNPLTQTEQKIKNTELAMNQAKLTGQPIGAEEWASYGNNWQQGVSYGLLPSAVIPTGGRYTIQNTDQGIQIAVQNGQKLDVPGTKRDEGQCGAFVNDCFGKRIVGNTFEQKMSLTDPSITMPTPGMAAVMETESPTGHIMMIEKVNYAKGLMDIVDANWNLDGKIQRRTIPISSVSGFIRPPNGQPVTAGTSTQVSGMTDGAILEAYEKAGKTFTSPNEANKAITLARQTGFVPGGKSSNKPITEAEKTTALYASRIKEAMDIFNALSPKVESLNAVDMAWQRMAPNLLKTSEFQKQEQAERNFINAVLRRESGAAIAASEFESAAKQYFPQPGDSSEVLAQKKQNRETVLKGLISSAGNAYGQNETINPSQEDEDLQLHTSFQNAPSAEDLSFYNSLQ